MAQLTNTCPAPQRRPGLVALDGGAMGARATPKPDLPAQLGLRRAAEIVENAAFDLAGSASATFVSRLIEIAAELERHARSGLDEAAFAGSNVAVLRRD